MFFMLLFLLPGLILGIYAQVKVTKTYNKYNRTTVSSDTNARELAEMIMEKEGIYDVTVNRIPGSLTDNYNPVDKTLNLSNGVYDSCSVSACGIAAHEVGHAIQHHKGYAPLKMRKVLVPVINATSFLAFPLALIGVLLEYFAINSPFHGVTVALIYSGIILYSLSTVFALITIPVELNASRRAKTILYNMGVVTKEEKRQVGEVLSAAALTYFASLLISVLYLLRFILFIFSIRRD